MVSFWMGGIHTHTHTHTPSLSLSLCSLIPLSICLMIVSHSCIIPGTQTLRELFGYAIRSSNKNHKSIYLPAHNLFESWRTEYELDGEKHRKVRNTFMRTATTHHGPPRPTSWLRLLSKSLVAGCSQYSSTDNNNLPIPQIGICAPGLHPDHHFHLFLFTKNERQTRTRRRRRRRNLKN